MTELYPIFSPSGRVIGVFGCGGDAIKICGGSGCKYYLWISTTEAKDVTSLLDRRRVLYTSYNDEKGFAPVGPWTRSIPYVHLRVIQDLDEYAEMVAKLLKHEIKGRTILVSFSGGKDSIAMLLTLLKIRDHVDFKLRTVYVYIPFLENPRSLDFIDKVSNRLGVEIEVVEAKRRRIKTLLRWKGLPRRGLRWCTVYKAMPIRKIRKEDPSVIEATGERLMESPKRFWRLKPMAQHRELLVGRKFRPIYLFTILDIIHVVRRSGLIHPDYMDGLPRVACSLCPFKSLYEYSCGINVEDPGLIDSVMEKVWRKKYSWIDYGEFRKQHLWRFDPKIAKAIYYAKKSIEAKEGLEVINADTIREYVRRMWTVPLPRMKAVDDPWHVFEYISKVMKKEKEFVILR